MAPHISRSLSDMMLQDEWINESFLSITDNKSLFWQFYPLNAMISFLLFSWGIGHWKKEIIC